MGERFGRERRGKALTLGTQGARFSAVGSVPGTLSTMYGHVRTCSPVRKAGWEGVGWSFPSSESLWMEARSSEPWERLRNGVHPVGLPQQKPWSCFVRHSFVCTCRGIRQHFETVYGDDSVNGLSHLSLLPEPASLQFQGKIRAIVNTPNAWDGFKQNCQQIVYRWLIFSFLSSSVFFF